MPGLKEVYEFLESTEDGRKIFEASKAELEKLKDAEAKARKADATIQKLTADIGSLSELKKKIEEAGIDPDDPAASVQKPQGKPESDKELEKVRKQLNTMQEKLETEKKAREHTEQRVRTETLRRDFGSALRDQMGKYGEILAENLINKGLVKLDDGGKVVYEVGDKIYAADEAVEVLKAEHKDFIVSKPTGSNLPPPVAKSTAAASAAGNPGLGGKTGDEIGKTSSRQWLKMGLSENNS